MASRLKRNFAFGSLAVDLAIPDSTMTLAAPHTVPIEAGTFVLVLWDIVTFPNPADDSNAEIILAEYSGTPNLYNVTRAQEFTTATLHLAGHQAALHLTSGMLLNDEFVLGNQTVVESALADGKYLRALGNTLVYVTPDLDEIDDGTTYERVLATSLVANEVVRLTDAGGDDLTVDLDGADRILTLESNVAVDQNLRTIDNVIFAGLENTGGRRFGFRESTGSTTTILTTDHYVSIQYTLTGTHIATLPAITSGIHRLVIILKDADYNSAINNITVATTGSDTIEKELTAIMNSNGMALSFLANNTTKNWEVF